MNEMLFAFEVLFFVFCCVFLIVGGGILGLVVLKWLEDKELV